MPNNDKKVTFNEPEMGYSRGPRGPRQSWPTKLIIKLGLAKDAKQASMVLVAIAVLAIAIMVIFWPRSGSANNTVLNQCPNISYIDIYKTT